MTEALTLDTSRRVECASSFQPIGWAIWSDLDPFTQGYIEAAKRDRRWLEGHSAAAGGNFYRDWTFADLAPETLAQIIAYCAEVARHRPATTPPDAESMKAWGRHVWKIRQAGGLVPHDPPVALYLDDDKVYLRESPQ